MFSLIPQQTVTFILVRDMSSHSFGPAYVRASRAELSLVFVMKRLTLDADHVQWSCTSFDCRNSSPTGSQVRSFCVMYTLNPVLSSSFSIKPNKTIEKFIVVCFLMPDLYNYSSCSPILKILQSILQCLNTLTVTPHNVTVSDVRIN